MSAAPSSSAFEGFVKDKSLTSEGLYLAEKKIEKTSVLSEEEIRVLMGRILSAKPQLKMFFEKHCLLKYLTLDQDDDPKEAGGAEITRGKDYLGYIEPVSADIIDFELDFEKATSFSTLKKVYNPIGKFPPISEDLAVILKPDISRT